MIIKSTFGNKGKKIAKNTIFRSIIDLFNDLKISLTGLVGLGCDGTAINTGQHNGVIQQFEKDLNRPIQRIICLLHPNELSLRHIFVHLHCATFGVQNYSGEIGKKTT